MSKKAVAGILPTERSPKARVLLVSASDGSHKVQWANHGLERRNAMSPTRIFGRRGALRESGARLRRAIEGLDKDISVRGAHRHRGIDWCELGRANIQCVW